MTLDQKKQLLIQLCQRLHQKGYLAASDGNLSFREDQQIWITPSGRAKAFIQPEELACVKIDGTPVRGKASSELKMHLAVYQANSKAQSVVHAHPPAAIAWSIAHPDQRFLPDACLSELILAVGSVPIAPFAFPGTEEMGKVLLPLIDNHRVMILARHGALTWGETLEEAYAGIERLEHTCEVLTRAKMLGGITDLPDDTVEKLREMRKTIGEKTL